MSDTNGVLATIFDRANNWLTVTQIAGTSTDKSRTGDENGIWSSVFDPLTGSIRVVIA